MSLFDPIISLGKEVEMRNNDRILNSLYASSIITAGLAWITIVILLGVLNG
jgi:hypothetical protein